MIAVSQELIETAEQMLRQKGIRPSHPRIVVLAILLEKKNHPTASEIMARLRQKGISIPKSTLYNVLSLFSEEGIVVPLSVDGEIRYDIDTTPHAHFQCIVCGKVYDISLEDIKINLPKSINGHMVISHNICIKGICRDCLEQMEGSPDSHS